MYKFLYKKELSSTNTFCKENRKFLEDKTVVFCDIQTNGRGRFDRKWLSFENKNICASIFLKISQKEQKILPNLTQYLSVIMCRIFEKYELNPQIKWPNDILINGKKIAGILAEGNFSDNQINSIVLGFGINVNSEKEDLKQIDRPTTSLYLETNQTFDKKILLKEIMDEFFRDFDKFIDDSFSFIEKDYKNRFYYLGKEIKLSLYKEKKKGIAKDITKDGFLVFVSEDNKKEIISAGEIDF